MSDSSNMEPSVSAVSTVMEDNSQSEQQVAAKDAFEEERKILLSGVAESLTSVVKLMAKANANLHGLDDSCSDVEKVADLWRDGYRRDV